MRHGRAFARTLRATWVEYERDRAPYLAVAMVYYALVSLIPLLMLLLAALGLLLRFSPTAVEAERQLLLGIEANFGPQVPAIVRQLLGTLEQESTIATVFGLVGLWLTASVLFKHLRLAFRAIWKYEPPLISGSVSGVLRVKIVEQFVSSLMVLGGGVLLLVGLMLIAISQWMSGLLGNLPLSSQSIAWLLAALSSLVLSAVTFALLFRHLPPVPPRWRDVWLAALLCAIAWVLASELLALYGLFFGRNRSAAGAIGGLLAIMLWMSVVSKMLFFGAELCKVVATPGGDSSRHQSPIPSSP